ncbi:MAG: hypothetical protein AB8G22_27070 [Saprospiraceae bacterium]
MFFTRKLCLLLLLLATIYSCEKENFNYVLDEAIPEPPVIIEKEEGIIQLTFNDEPSDTLRGFAKTEDNIVYIISNGEIECRGDGSFRAQGSLFMNLIRFDEIAFVNSVSFAREINGEEVSLMAEGTLFDCGRNRPLVELEEISDSEIKGKLTADFYIFDVDGGGDCEELWTYYGELTLAFAIPVEPCD